VDTHVSGYDLNGKWARRCENSSLNIAMLIPSMLVQLVAARATVDVKLNPRGVIFLCGSVARCTALAHCVRFASNK
jgi:hypothetical protein